MCCRSRAVASALQPPSSVSVLSVVTPFTVVDSVFKTGGSVGGEDLVLSEAVGDLKP